MLIEVSDSDLSIIKSIGLKILLEVRRICEAHNIKYTIYAGTLLGAVRHGGFIPWDNDVDVAMLRDEYEKFVEYAKCELAPGFELVNYSTNNYCGEPFSKVMAKGTVMKEAFTGSSNAPDGVFVDVFPLDNVPDNLFARKIHQCKNYTLRKKILIQSNYAFNKTGVKKILYKAIDLTTFAPRKKLVSSYNRNAVKYCGKKTSFVTILGGNYGYYKEIIPREIFDEYVNIVFEGEEFMAVKEYDYVLSHYYGNYMELPPIEERGKKHRVEKLDLSAYGGSKIGFN